MAHENDEKGCEIIMPLFDFFNKDEVEFAFLDGRYKLQRFSPTDELINEVLRLNLVVPGLNLIGPGSLTITGKEECRQKQGLQLAA